MFITNTYLLLTNVIWCNFKAGICNIILCRVIIDNTVDTCSLWEMLIELMAIPIMSIWNSLWLVRILSAQYQMLLQAFSNISHHHRGQWHAGKATVSTHPNIKHTEWAVSLISRFLQTIKVNPLSHLQFDSQCSDHSHWICWTSQTIVTLLLTTKLLHQS